MIKENPRFPHNVTITRPTYNGPFDEGGESAVVYEGKCRSYSKLNTSASGEVLSSMRVCAIPISTTEWTIDNLPKTDDEVEIRKGVQTEYGKVIDVLTNNFGTNIIWEYVRN